MQLLLGYQSEKVRKLWAKVKEKDAFCARFGYSRTFIERVMNGKHKLATPRVYKLINDLALNWNYSTAHKVFRPTVYRFLHPMALNGSFK